MTVDIATLRAAHADLLQLEDDVRYYSGGETAGYAEIGIRSRRIVNNLIPLCDLVDAQAARVAELEQQMRMIVSHATGGACQDITLSTNDISVEITRHVNRVWDAAQEAARAAAIRASKSNG
ncbi:MAG: hypothetical protein V4530_05935 [Pseudomonadota bacterium]